MLSIELEEILNCKSKIANSHLIVGTIYSKLLNHILIQCVYFIVSTLKYGIIIIGISFNYFNSN